ncbi:MAG: DUF1559 domain-containing protein [Gemmataceae bacterium]|nr:DUF1559 domain-containing protein [Gemmataceae bacterium]
MATTAKDRDGWRAGVSLIELTVVVAVSGLLIGLTMGAVQRVRGAAARAACMNNVRQIGLALHQFHDARGMLPPGVSSRGGKDSQPFVGWSAQILPYLEHEALWAQSLEAYRVTADFVAPPHPGRTLLKAFACPLDSRVGPAGGGGRMGMGLTSYLGVEGLNSARQDGVLYLDSATRLTDVVDGTSSTLMVGERPPSASGVYGWWYAGWGQEKDGCLDLTLGVRTKNYSVYDRDCPTGPFPFAPKRADDPCHHFQFWSLHTNGAHFLFVDGSVSSLSYRADGLLPALASRAGGEAAQLPE